MQPKCPSCGEPTVKDRVNCPKCGAAYPDMEEHSLQLDPDRQGEPDTRGQGQHHPLGASDV